ncbi:ABC transporter substrate-binding protein [Microbacterium saperdae]|uniref:Carbohydrate ABC transporter substrate-binding protein (CUT1 family) n=1 Tax=Microbacterium saperdae TaxID=69368 RepID=A0A543BAU6_9MICO|nr:extracellular solute-binding protein [Microbacterium saperdae]TQL81922.1 carbohydrate ABC transporter substrate-binding protein (CUT1 family) [Microbacterium saperdae]GGM35773.1 sugar ABC transporter substrate-binding protein [Microbacterium saperdae]
MTTVKRITLRMAGGIAAAAVAMSLAACGSSADDAGSDTFTILQYENPESAQGQGWQLALEIFQKKHPDVKVDFQTTSFDAMRQNAKITLTGDKVPDVIEFNKGNADGGQLAGQGLLAPLDDQVAEYGWDEKVTGGMQAFAQYDEQGLAGSGNWYGVPNIGEYVMFYYNKELFAEAGITEQPATLEEFEANMDALVAAGITPISSSASTSQGFNQMWIWYSLVAAEADRAGIDDFMFLREPVDFSKAPWKTAADRFQSWIDKGYVGEELGGLNFEQATVNFLSGDKAMLIWNQGEFARIREQATFDWGYFTLPGANLQMGSSGHLWGVPANAKNKELSYDWIDITLSEEVQNKIGQLGGLPLAGDASTIEDELTREYTERFNELLANDSLAFYPDYPVPGFLDFIQSNMQAMSNRNEDADEYTDKLQKFYDEGRETALAG